MTTRLYIGYWGSLICANVNIGNSDFGFWGWMVLAVMFLTVYILSLLGEKGEIPKK